MKILIYSISYLPELAGTGRFNGEMATWLSEQGHSVDVITAHPYYPEWKVKENYKGRGWFKEKLGNLTIYRTPLYVPNQVTGSTRILHELSFVLASTIHWIKIFSKNYDIIIAVCPPLQIGIFPYIYGSLRSIPFLFHVQDLQVDAARLLGMIKNKLLLDSLDRIETFLLQKATWVSSISEGMKQKILLKGVKKEKYLMFENWVDTDIFRPISTENSFKSKLGFDVNDRIALYSGNLGEKQGLFTLIEAANLLKEDEQIKIVICGEGANKDQLQREVATFKLKNVFFFPIRPYEELPQVLAMADVHLVIQKRATSDLVMPSKLTNVLAMGGGAIISAEANTWLNKLVFDHKLGWVVEPENALVLATTIREAIYSDDLAIYRANARSYAITYLNKQNIMKRFETFLKTNIQVTH